MSLKNYLILSQSKINLRSNNIQYILTILIGLSCSIQLKSQAIRNYTIEISCKSKYYNSSNSILDFKWRNRTPTASSQIVYRKSKNTLSWGSAFRNLSNTDTSFSDTIPTGLQYEYMVEKTDGPYSFSYPVYGYITAGHQVPAISARGKILLIIDSTHRAFLDTSLRVLRNDLIGDGWIPVVKYFSPSTTVSQIKSYILSTYKSDPTNVKSLLLIGDLAVPYAGDFHENRTYPPDGHTSVNTPGASHEGAWPADCYYGDVLTDSLWTDSIVSNSSGSRSANNNAIGDGKFDNTLIPYLITLQVGRLDLSDMSSFSLSERELLKQYLKRDHDYRNRVYSVKERCLLDDVFGTALVPEDFANNAYRNMAPLINDTCTKAKDYLKTLDTADYMWSFGYGYGGYNYNSAIGYTADIASASQNIKSVFSGFFGSYFIDWDNSNNFLRAPLASKGYVLNTFAVGRPHWFFHHMGMGDPIGFSTMMSQNNFDTSNASLLYPSLGYSYWNIHPALMGDPTIRMQMVDPAKNFAVNQDGCSHNFKLKWQASIDTAVHTYFIYRSKDIDSSFSLLSSTSQLTFIDSFPLNGNNVYMIRDMKLQLSGSGTYYNLGQGVFASINTNNYFKPNIYAGRDSTFCKNQSIKLGRTNSNSNTIYNWSPNTSTKDTTTFIPKTSANYILTATDTMSICIVKDTVQLTLQGPVSETITQSMQNSCKDSTNFSSTLRNGNGFNYAWVFPSGNPASVSGTGYSNPGLVNYLSTGSFINTLIITDTINGCKHIDSSLINVSCLQALPVDNFLFSCDFTKNDLYRISFYTYEIQDYEYYIIEGLTKDNKWNSIVKLDGQKLQSFETSIDNHVYIGVKLSGRLLKGIDQQLDYCEGSESWDAYNIYPNPAQTELNLDIFSNKNKSNVYRIYNSMGQEITVPIKIMGSNTIRFDIDEIVSGNYILVIYSGDTIKTYKFIKE